MSVLDVQTKIAILAGVKQLKFITFIIFRFVMALSTMLVLMIFV